MYKLYGWKMTGSMATEAAFAEAGVEFELVPVNQPDGEQLGEAYRQINPRQQLPALMLPDGTVMTEGSAILLHIADAFPEAGLAPNPGSSERAQHDRWLIYCAVNVYEGELRKLNPEKYVTGLECVESVKQSAFAYVDRHYRIFEAALGEGPYFFGDRFCMLDIYIWMLAQWLDQDWLTRECPKIKRLADTASKRPKIAPIHQAHFS